MFRPGEYPKLEDVTEHLLITITASSSTPQEPPLGQPFTMASPRPKVLLLGTIDTSSGRALWTNKVESQAEVVLPKSSNREEFLAE